MRSSHPCSGLRLRARGSTLSSRSVGWGWLCGSMRWTFIASLPALAVAAIRACILAHILAAD
eukprot:8708035-Alexandrium_andersonii.AAC.1